MKTERKVSEITRLQYKLQRYKRMGYGVACQSLNAKIHKLMAQQSNV